MKKIFCALLIAAALACPVYADDLPTSFDMRPLLPKIKSQSPWGTCWAFASMGAIEADYLMNRSNDIDLSSLNLTSSDLNLSELFLAYFAHAPKGNVPDRTVFPIFSGDKLVTNPTINQILGGGTARVTTAIYSRGFGYGPVKASGDMSYSNVNNDNEKEFEARMKNKRAWDYESVLRLKETAEFDNLMNSEEERNALKKLILQHGGAYFSYSDANIARNNQYYSYYAPYDVIDAQKDTGGHAVAVVGWDDNFSRSKFKYDPGIDGAWLIRNSWGEESEGHDKGYFWASYKLYSSAVVFIMESVDKTEALYDHAPLSWSNVNWGTGEAWGANVYKVTSPDQKLIKVGFATLANSADVEIFVNKSYGMKAPTAKDIKSGDLVYSGTLPYCGYHSVSIDHAAIDLTSGDYFSVMIHVKNPSAYSKSNALAVSFAEEGETDSFFNFDGQSFLSSNGTDWQDGAYEVSQEGAATPTSVFLKAFVSLPAAVEDDPLIPQPIGTITGLSVIQAPDGTVPEDYILAVNPVENENSFKGRKIIHHVVDESGDLLTEGTEVEVDLVLIQDLYDTYSNDVSKWGLKTPSLVEDPLYPVGYKPSGFFYGIDEASYMLFPVYSTVMSVDSKGQILIDADNLKVISGDKIKIPTGYYDIFYAVRSGDEEPFNFEGKTSGWLRVSEITSADSSGGGTTPDDSGNVLRSSGGGCTLGLGGLLGLALAAVVFKKKR